MSAILLHYSRRPVPLPPQLQGQLVDGHFPETDADPYLLFRIRPGVKEEHYSTNSKGLRGPEFQAREGQLRVLLLGGSVAWSYVAPSDRETLGAALSQDLSRRLQSGSPDRWQSVAVLNAAVPAYVSRQSAVAYARSRRQLGAQVVISLDGVNDVSAAVTTGVGNPLYLNGTAPRFEAGREAITRSFPRWLWMRFERSKFNRYRRILRPLHIRKSNPPAPSEVARSYSETILYLASLTAVDGAALIPVLQPVCMFEQARTLTPYERELARRHERERPGLNAYFGEVYREFRKTLATAAELEQVFPLDATGAFQSEPGDCFVDCYHLTATGIERLAEEMGRHIVEVLEITGRRP